MDETRLRDGHRSCVRCDLHAGRCRLRDRASGELLSASGVRAMKLRLWNPLEAFRPKVKPDPIAAAELEKRMRSVRFVPENGFHRDQLQPRAERKQPT